MADEEYLSDQQVAAKLGISRTTVWRWLKSDHTFPRPLSLPGRVTRFSAIELDQWLDTKRAAS